MKALDQFTAENKALAAVIACIEQFGVIKGSCTFSNEVEKARLALWSAYYAEIERTKEAYARYVDSAERMTFTV